MLRCVSVCVVSVIKILQYHGITKYHGLITYHSIEVITVSKLFALFDKVTGDYITTCLQLLCHVWIPSKREIKHAFAGADPGVDKGRGKNRLSVAR